MIATMLLSGVLLADPGGTISYEKKVMVDPDYRPSRTAEEIRATLSDRHVAPPAVRHLSPPRAPAPRVVYTAVARPRVTWSVGATWGSPYRYDGWGTRIGVHYGGPVYRYSYSCTSPRPASWAIGVGYRTSWGFLGLRYGSAWRAYDCAPRYTHAYSCSPSRWSGDRRRYRTSHRAYRSHGGRRRHR